MGGIFSSPEPPAPAPASAPSSEPAPLDLDAETNDDPEESAREARLESIARRRRGRTGTIKTSATGALAPIPGAQAGKTKLGE
ncbi:hypothetical protein KAJ83_15670 [Marivibrio halodurans]|uniref:Uncharacterized protein n=1 Tax=Marivibrio halodurans TaxID=2039722 RepID=A0A8J7S7X3_9PROT|nr:hypothetical protein [Marivibrio halodurans]MBP5858459.1 hypothetical protein [Marivibrio halodurans]